MPEESALVTRVKTYLGASTNVPETELGLALVAEQHLQERCCRVPAADDMTPAAVAARSVLEEALCRRVAVNLARRGVPLGMQLSDVGTARISTKDPEVRRLEGPYRKVVLA